MTSMGKNLLFWLFIIYLSFTQGFCVKAVHSQVIKDQIRMCTWQGAV